MSERQTKRGLKWKMMLAGAPLATGYALSRAVPKVRSYELPSMPTLPTMTNIRGLYSRIPFDPFSKASYASREEQGTGPISPPPAKNTASVKKFPRQSKKSKVAKLIEPALSYAYNRVHSGMKSGIMSQVMLSEPNMALYNQQMQDEARNYLAFCDKRGWDDGKCKEKYRKKYHRISEGDIPDDVLSYVAIEKMIGSTSNPQKVQAFKNASFVRKLQAFAGLGGPAYNAIKQERDIRLQAQKISSSSRLSSQAEKVPLMERDKHIRKYKDVNAIVHDAVNIYVDKRRKLQAAQTQGEKNIIQSIANQSYNALSKRLASIEKAARNKRLANKRNAINYANRAVSSLKKDLLK